MAREIVTGIYKIKNTINHKLYIGSAVNIHTRWNRHKHNLRKGNHHSIKLQRAWDKYGENNFIFEIMLICNRNDLQFYEQSALDVMNSYNAGYNSNPFARTSLGAKHTEETKKKLSEIAKKRKYSLETRAKISIALRRREIKPETVEKLRLINSGKIVSEETRRKIAESKIGKKHSEEHKKKISNGLKGRIQSKETRNKISMAMMGNSNLSNFIKDKEK